MKISPSDFAYLYEDCKHCYCLKVLHGISQPSMPMPGVFSTMNSILQGSLVGKSLKTLSSELPDGMVVKQEGWIDSVDIPGTSLFVKGKYDLLVENGDGTHTIVDLKISKPGDDKVEKYKSQLSAYKFALENPKTGEPIVISKLALLIFYPDSVKFENDIANLVLPPKWLEVPYEEIKFFGFVKEVENLLTGSMPEENPDCRWCKYRHIGEQFSHTSTLVGDEAPF